MNNLFSLLKSLPKERKVYSLKDKRVSAHVGCLGSFEVFVDGKFAHDYRDFEVLSGEWGTQGPAKWKPVTQSQARMAVSKGKTVRRKCWGNSSEMWIRANASSMQHRAFELFLPQANDWEVKL